MIRRTRGQQIFEVFNYTLLILLSAAFVIPFVIVLSTSLVSQAELARRGQFVLFPQDIDFTAYRVILGRGSQLWRNYGVSVFRITVGTFLNLAFTGSFAFVLSRRQLPLRKGITLLVFFTMLFGGGLIPTFLLVRFLGMYNTLWALVFPGLINAWWMFIMRNFFYSIPASLEEAAIIDGATPAQTLLRIYLPLSLPAFATIGLFYAVWHWNSWFDAMIYIPDTSRQPIQVVLRRVLAGALLSVNDETMLDMNEIPPADTMKSAIIMVTTLPILFVYPFVQKYFVKGVMIGSIKG